VVIAVHAKTRHRVGGMHADLPSSGESARRVRENFDDLEAIIDAHELRNAATETESRTRVTVGTRDDDRATTVEYFVESQRFEMNLAHCGESVAVTAPVALTILQARR